MATVRDGGILAAATARPEAGFSVSADAQIGRVHMFGRSAAVLYHLDEDECSRRLAVGLKAVTRMDLLDLLLALPYGYPVPHSALSEHERGLIHSLPAGCVESANGTIVRRIAVPLTVDLAAVRSRDWRRGLDEASQFAPFCSRTVVLERVPVDADSLLVEAAYYGIGVLVADAGTVRILANPEPFTKQNHKAAGWWFAEEIYTQLSESAVGHGLS